MEQHHHDPGQIYIRLQSSLIWVHAVCPKAIEHFSTQQMAKQFFFAIGTLRVFFLHINVLFDLILYVPSTIFQLNRDGLNQY